MELKILAQRYCFSVFQDNFLPFASVISASAVYRCFTDRGARSAVLRISSRDDIAYAAETVGSGFIPCGVKTKNSRAIRTVRPNWFLNLKYRLLFKIACIDN